MAKQIHTHRGHCQLCARIQAIETQTGTIAEHGYTRRGGYFSGSCPGSGLMNLHVSRTTADARIAAARGEVTEQRAMADSLTRRETHPEKAWTGEFKMVRASGRDITARSYILEGGAMYSKLERARVYVAWDKAPKSGQDVTRNETIRDCLERAKICEDYANFLESWAYLITGKVDPYQVQDLEPREWEVGDTVHIGGKKGYDATVKAVEIRPYTTFGVRRGRSTVNVKHVRITQPEVTEKRVSEKAGGYVSREARPAKVIWVAMRDIKDRKPNPLAEELAKAGLL